MSREEILADFQVSITVNQSGQNDESCSCSKFFVCVMMLLWILSTLSFHQACTGIDDLGIAIMHLEEADWVLVVRKTYFTI